VCRPKVRFPTAESSGGCRPSGVPVYATRVRREDPVSEGSMQGAAAHVLVATLVAGGIVLAPPMVVAQVSARADGPARVPGQARVGPEFSANRPIQLVPAVEGEGLDAPLRFGRSHRSQDGDASSKVAQASPGLRPQRSSPGSDRPPADAPMRRMPGDVDPGLGTAVAGREQEAKALAR